MADFGIVTVCTHYTIQPGELGQWCENNGFESLWYGEHSHIPTSRETPFPMGGELPQFYKEFFDPFIGLTAAATATTAPDVCIRVSRSPSNKTARPTVSSG